jgi:methionyl-tRNA formyltransferase
MFQGLLNNEPSLGYSLHFIDKKVDTGDILFQESIKFSKNDSVCRLSLKSHIQASIQLKNMVEQFLLMKSFEPILPKEEKSYFSWPTKDQISNFVKSGYHLISLSDFFQLIFYNKEKIIEN